MQSQFIINYEKMVNSEKGKDLKPFPFSVSMI
jgi:hypothetical protein